MPSEQQQDDDDKTLLTRRLRFEAAAALPLGTGRGGRHQSHRAIDHPLQPCNFQKQTRFDSLPIEQACFVLLGFEPPPLGCLRFEQATYWPEQEPTWESPPEYDDVLRALRLSIDHGSIQAQRITEYPYDTQQVLWPELIRWASSKSLSIPAELEATLVQRLEGQAVYDTTRDVLWLANANYLGAQSDNGAPMLLSQVNTDPLLGFSDWRLPATFFPDAGCSSQDGTGTNGFGCTDSEMGHLIYDEMGGVAGGSILARSRLLSVPAHRTPATTLPRHTMRGWFALVMSIPSRSQARCCSLHFP